MQKNRTDKKPLIQPKLPAEGPQGVDKAPGEDPAGKPGTGLKKELSGKKVDGDPKNPADRPVKQP